MSKTEKNNIINVFTSRDRRWAGDVAHVRAKRHQCIILMKFKVAFGRSRHRC